MTSSASGGIVRLLPGFSSSADGAKRGVAPVVLPVFTGVLLAAALALYLGPVANLPAPTPSFHLPWLVLALGFLVAEIVVVHYDFRSEAHSFSLSELPLIFGLFFVAPTSLVTAQLAGAGAALLFHRRQTGLKLLFNLAHFALGTCLAVLLFQLVRNSTDILGSESWPAALLAAVLSSLLSTLAIFVAISVSQNRAEVGKLPEQLSLAMLATVGGASLGLLGVEATSRHPPAALLLAVPVATFLLAYRAYVVQRQEHDSLEFLYESSRVLDAAADLPSAMGSMLRGACLTFRSEIAQFAVLSDGGRKALLITTTADEVRTAGYVEVGAVDELLLQGMKSGQAQLMTLRPPMAGPNGEVLREVMVGPVGSNTRTQGALLLGNRLGTGSFSAAQLRLFQTMVAQIDVSLENGRLAQMLGEATRYAERERANSLELQRGLLPSRLPDYEGVSVAVRYQPSGVGVEVGGDWYDVLVLSSGALGLVIGDVIGHDLRSAARMAQARSALRAYATEGHDPATVMQRLNWLLAQTDPDFMGTCVYAEYRPEEGTVTLVLAGHPPPLIIPTSGSPYLVSSEPGLPLGVDDQAVFKATTIDLAPGETVVFFTDGLVESKAVPLRHGLRHITELPGMRPDATVEEIADRLLASMPEGVAGDDVAMVVLRADPVAGLVSYAG